jgi:hypothetical protein
MPRLLLGRDSEEASLSPSRSPKHNSSRLTNNKLAKILIALLLLAVSLLALEF